MEILRLPSGSNSDYDLLVIIPYQMPIEKAVTAINRIIYQANKEDRGNGGFCDDGKSVEENIRRQLDSEGFVFKDPIDTLTWDDFHDVSELDDYLVPSVS